MRLSSVLSLCLFRLYLTTAQSTTCSEIAYQLGPGSVNCYRYAESVADFITANRTCVREGGSMVYIESAEEDQYIKDAYFTGKGVEFWIGLNDVDTEGTFRWTNISTAFPLQYSNWTGGTPTVRNSQAKDCVKFSANGWIVHDGLCSTSHLPFLCKMPSCQSNVLPYCIGQEPTDPPTPASPAGLIAGVIVVIIVVAIIIVTVILCVLVWKFNNDAFYRYLCCCVQGKSGPAMHSLQQENQRLRHELSQHKVSVSGRFSQGAFGGRNSFSTGELSGVPDGRGGVLPTIKQVSTTSPIIPESRPSMQGTGIPPPLILQRANSRVIPVTGRVSIPGQTTPVTSGPKAGLFISGHGNNPPQRPVRQSAPTIATRLNSFPHKPSSPITEVKGEHDDSDTDSNSETSKVDVESATSDQDKS